MFECFLRDRKDPMIQILEEQNLLRDRGEAHWGHFIQANDALFRKNNTHTCPAHMVFSTEPFFDDRPNLLAEVASTLRDMKGTKPGDAGLVDVAHVITDEHARLLSRELPRAFCHGHSVHFATVFVEPRQLPGRYLAQLLVPVMANLKETPGVMVLPASYWPKEMVADWDPNPVKAAPVRPKTIAPGPEDKTVEGVPDTLPPPPPRPGFFARLFGRHDPRPSAAAKWLRTIAFSPDNDDLLVAFADWLDACGENTQAEVIRLQMQSERYAENDPLGSDPYNRAAEIIQANVPRWLGPLKAMGLEPWVGTMFMPFTWYHRGLLDQVCVNMAGILPEQADRLFAAAPALQRITVQGIKITPDGHGFEWEPDLARMFWVPQMRQIHEIDTGTMSLTLENASVLGEIPYLSGLHRLTAGGSEYGLEASLALAKSPYLTELRELNLGGWGMGEEGMQALAHSGLFAKLSRLNLGACYMGPGGAESLFKSAKLGPITSLDLDRNRLTDTGLACLAQCPALSRLTHVALAHASVTARGIAVLAGSPTMARLKNLALDCNDLDSECVKILACSPHLARLRRLKLSANKITDEGAYSLADSATIQSLTELLLDYNSLGDGAGRAVAESSCFKRLRNLSLSSNKIGADGAIALAESRNLEALEELNLSNNPIGLAGAKALAKSRTLRRLNRLHIAEPDVGAKGMALLRDRFGDGLWEAAADADEPGVPHLTIDDILSGRT